MSGLTRYSVKQRQQRDTVKKGADPLPIVNSKLGSLMYWPPQQPSAGVDRHHNLCLRFADHDSHVHRLCVGGCHLRRCKVHRKQTDKQNTESTDAYSTLHSMFAKDTAFPTLPGYDSHSPSLRPQSRGQEMVVEATQKRPAFRRNRDGHCRPKLERLWRPRSRQSTIPEFLLRRCDSAVPHARRGDLGSMDLPHQSQGQSPTARTNNRHRGSTMETQSITKTLSMTSRPPSATQTVDWA